MMVWYGSDNDDGGDRNVDRESGDNYDCEMDKGKYDITTSILTMNCFLM